MPAFRCTVYRRPKNQVADLATLPATGTEDTAPAKVQPRPFAIRKEEIRRGHTPDDVEDQLIGEGYEVVDVVPIDHVASWQTRFRTEKVVLYRHLARALQRKVLMNLADDFLPMFPPSSPFREPARAFLNAIEKQPIYKAMAAMPKVFADFEVNLLEIGANGNEALMLMMLSDALGLESKVNRWWWQLLLYPLIVALFLTAAVAVYYVFALPKMLGNTHLDPGEHYPLYLQIIMLPYHMFTDPVHGIISGTIIGSIIAGLLAAYIFLPAVQFRVEYALFFWTGPYGRLLRSAIVIRLLKILQLMLRNGQQDEAYNTLRGAAVGRVIAFGLDSIFQASLRGGKSWAHALYGEDPKKARVVHGTLVFSRPIIGRIVNAETLSAVTGMIEEIGILVDELTQEGELLFEELKTKMNASAVFILGGVVGMLYLTLYMPVQFVITHMGHR